MGANDVAVAIPETSISPSTLQLIASWPDNVKRAFADYLALPMGSRSTRALADSYANDDTAPTRSASTLEAWCTRYGWIPAAGDVLGARLASSQSEVLEYVAHLSMRAAVTMGELLDAEKGVVLPTGGIAYMPDNTTRLKAAAELLDRGGASAIQRSTITHQGSDGGPVRVAHLVADLDGLSGPELLALMRADLGR